MKSKEIRTFLKNLTTAENHYLSIQLSMAKDARALMQEFSLSKERFCSLVNIDIKDYDDYVKGSYNYSLESMARNQAIFVTLRMKQAEKEAKDKFTNSLG